MDMDCPIFISYSRKDLDTVEALYKEIEEKTGVKCWIDLRGIASGDQFDDKVAGAIDKAEVAIFMLSENSLKSKNTKKEVNYAEDNGKKVVPVIIDGTSMDKFPRWFRFDYGRADFIDIQDTNQKKKLFRDISSWVTLQGPKESLKKTEEPKVEIKEESQHKPVSQQTNNGDPITPEIERQMNAAEKASSNPYRDKARSRRLQIKFDLFKEHMAEGNIDAILEESKEIGRILRKHNDEELEFYYLLAKSIFTPDDFYRETSHRIGLSYWTRFFRIISLLKLGHFDEASEEMDEYDIFECFSEDNLLLLDSSRLLMKNSYAEAKRMFAAVTGEFSPLLKPLADSIAFALDPSLPNTLGRTREDCAFYLVNLFGLEDTRKNARKTVEETKKDAVKEREDAVEVDVIHEVSKDATATVSHSSSNPSSKRPNTRNRKTQESKFDLESLPSSFKFEFDDVPPMVFKRSSHATVFTMNKERYKMEMDRFSKMSESQRKDYLAMYAVGVGTVATLGAMSAIAAPIMYGAIGAIGSIGKVLGIGGILGLKIQDIINWFAKDDNLDETVQSLFDKEGLTLKITEKDYIINIFTPKENKVYFEMRLN